MKKLIGMVAVLSSAHLIGKLDYNNLSMLDYGVIVSAMAAIIVMGLALWRGCK